MTYVIVGSCIKDDSCIEVCPVDCIHPKPGRARLRDRRAALHRPRGLHRLRRLRRGVPGRRDLRRTSRSPRSTSYALELNAEFFAEREHRRAHRRVMAPRATARGDRRRRAGGRVRRRRPPARPRRRGDRPVSSGCPRRGACCAAASRPTTRRSSASRTRSTARRSRRGCRFLGNVEVGTDISHDELMRHYTRGDLRDRRADRQVARHPRRGPARQLGGHRVRRLVQRPPRLPRPRVRPARPGAPS